MNIKQNLANSSNYGGTRNSIKYIVIHYTGNDGDTDEANANYFKNNIVKASAHYFVDDDSITLSVPENRVAYSVGGSKYKNIKGASFYGKCTNNNSISIELCDTRRNGRYDFSEATLNNAIELVKELMMKYNVSIENVIRHYDVTGKICPEPFVKDENAWKDFKLKLANNDKIKYKVHIQNIGWQEQKENGELAGTEGQALRIEAIIIDSTVPLQYRVHIQDKGWTDWVPQSCMAGTTGEGKRLEAIEIISQKEIQAIAHIQDIGWQEKTKGTHIKIGTEGRALRLEALKLKFL